MRTTALPLFLTLILWISSIANAQLMLPRLPPELGKIFYAQENDIDIGRAALILAKQVYPNINVEQYSTRIDLITDQVRSAAAGSTDPERRIRALNSVFFLQEGFRYDRETFSRSRQEHYFLHGILDSKKGTCYIMPILYAAIAQRVGYPISVVIAPDHMFVRYSDPSFDKQNIEVTSGGQWFPDQHYVDRFKVSKSGLKSGAYMRSLSKRELLSHFFYATGNVLGHQKNGLLMGMAYIQRAIELDSKHADALMVQADGFEVVAEITKGEEGKRYADYARSLKEKAAELGWVDPATVPQVSVRDIRGVK
jgi:regulator of sirC expression with transglutaminase-like and TPR domain